MSQFILQTVDRSLELMELLSQYPAGLTSGEIERELQLNKLTVHRLLSTLENRKFIERLEGGRRYGIGLKLVELCSVRLNTVEIKTEAQPCLRELAEKLVQPTHLAILSGREAVYIEKIDPVNTIRMYSQIGKRIPLYASAVGKALLMDADDGIIKKAFPEGKAEMFTDTTLHSADELAQEVRRARQWGFAIDNEEHEPGVFCCAAPVYDYRGQLIAAVSTAGRKKGFLTDPADPDAEAVKEAARQISLRMGFQGR